MKIMAVQLKFTFLELLGCVCQTFKSIETLTIASKLRVSSNLRGLLTFVTITKFSILY